MSSITESKPLQVESETLMTTPLGLTVYPDVALAFSQPPTEQMLTELQQDTPSDTIKASFQTASAFLQTLYSETSDLVLKALHKSQATEKKLSSLDQPASETSMDAIHAHYMKIG